MSETLSPDLLNKAAELSARSTHNASGYDMRCAFHEAQSLLGEIVDALSAATASPASGQFQAPDEPSPPLYPASVEVAPRITASEPSAALMDALGAAAKSHYEQSNDPKSKEWQRKAHAHAYGGICEAMMIVAQMASSTPDVERPARTEAETAGPDDVEVWGALGEAYGAMGAAFQRIHSLPRSEDGAIADRLGRARGRIEQLKAARAAS